MPYHCIVTACVFYWLVLEDILHLPFTDKRVGEKRILGLDGTQARQIVEQGSPNEWVA